MTAARLGWPRSGWMWVALWLLLTCAGWGVSQAVPPMQSPDENQHIARAYLLGQGLWGLEAPPGQMSGGAVDAGLTTYIRQHMLLAGQPAFRLSAAQQAQLRQLKWRSDAPKPHFEMPGTGYYLPVIYAPHALALRVSEALGLRVHTSYQVARFVVLGSTLALMLWAFALLGPGMAVVGVLLLPMTLFQLVLPTLDGFTTGLALVSIALFARLLQPPSAAVVRWWEPAVLGACLLLVVTSRIHLLPMVLIFGVLAWRRREWGNAAWGMAVMVCAVAWLVFAIGSTVDTRIPRDHTTTQLATVYLMAPWEFVKLLINTLLHADVRQFYGRSFIGILGWLDAPLPNAFYAWIGWGLALCFVGGVSLRSFAADWAFRTAMLTIAITSFFMIFFALLITWTPHPAEVIAGVQGRYFIVPAILIGYALHGSGSVANTARNLSDTRYAIVSRYAKPVRILLLIAFATMCMVALLSCLHTRYAS